jgi:hypothetical protein
MGFQGMWNPPAWNRRRRLDPPSGPETHLSEVHVGGADGAARDVITRFAFVPPTGLNFGRGDNEVEEEEAEEEDADGDLAVPRKRRRTDNQQCITVRHHMATSLPDVGLQVRRQERKMIGTRCRHPISRAVRRVKVVVTRAWHGDTWCGG